MANYKNTVGKPIKFLSSNLDNSEGGGQIWYNSSDENFKIMPALNAWSSGGSLTTPKYEMSGFGTQTAAVMAAGRTTAASTDVQEYNGTGYTSASNYPIAMRNGTGCGTETAGLVFGGRGDTPTTGNNAPVSVTAEYDGSSWTVGGSMGAGRYGLGAAGSQTAAVGFAGYVANNPPFTPPAGDSNRTEEYNGTAWTTGNTMGTARYRIAGNGTQTAALGAGGYVYPSTVDRAETEEYDGTNWSSGANMPEGKKGPRSWGAQTNAVLSGGSKPPTLTAITATINYDGSSWSSNPATLATGRMQMGASTGTSASSAVFSGGQNSGATAQLNITEEYNQSATVVTGAAFASGGNMVDGRGFLQMAPQATQSASLVFGGWEPSPTGAVSLVEEYNGSSWSEVNNMPETKYYGAGAGTQTAALGTGGYGGSPETINNKTFEYDGTNWTAGGTLTVTRAFLGGTGTQTAGVVFGGGAGGAGGPTATEEYDGSSWTASNVLPQANTSMIAIGIQTAALSAGGEPATAKNSSAEYDGTNWTAGNNMNIVRSQQAGGFGTQTSAIVACGNTPPGNNALSSSEQYDGTSFVTGVNAATARKYMGSTGATQSNGLLGGGDVDGSTNTNATEEYTPESSGVNVKTITTS